MFPIEPSLFGGFVVAAVAIIISPGPDTIVILRHALTGGRRIGLAAVSGVQLGLVAHTALAVAGISLIIASSPVLFKAVTFAGAAYLGWLAIQGFRSALIDFGAADGTLRISAAKAARASSRVNSSAIRRRYGP